MSQASPMDDPSKHELLQAQVTQVELQNEKLRHEAADQQRRKPWHHALIEMTPIITACIAVAGFLFGVIQFRAEQQKNRASRDTQSQREKELAEREFMKPWLENQREIYSQALTAAVTVANTDELDESKSASSDFWMLYHGNMVLVETKSVSGAMVKLGHCFDGSETCDKPEMNKRCHALATAMAESLAATSKMTYEEFSTNQFKYSSGK